MQRDHKRCSENNVYNSMVISVEGRQVALHFAQKPDVQVALKVKQALLGTYLAAGK